MRTRGEANRILAARPCFIGADLQSLVLLHRHIVSSNFDLECQRFSGDDPVGLFQDADNLTDLKLRETEEHFCWTEPLHRRKTETNSSARNISCGVKMCEQPCCLYCQSKLGLGCAKAGTVQRCIAPLSLLPSLETAWPNQPVIGTRPLVTIL